MAKKDPEKTTAVDRRQPAQAMPSATEGGTLAAADVSALVHDLQTHEVELRIQNEELRRAQEELELSRGKYLDLFDLSPTAYFMLDEGGRILEANLAGVALLGAGKRRVKKSPFARFVARQDQDAFHLHFREALRTGERQKALLNLVKADGALVQARLETSRVPGADEPGRCLMAVMDLTELQRAQEDIRYLARLLNEVSEAVISTDLGFKILSWNKGAEEIYGWRAAEVVGKHTADLLETEFADGATMDEVMQQFQRDGAWTGQVIQTRKDGARIPVSSAVSALRDSAGEVVGFVGVNRDITKRRHMEEELARREAWLRLVVEHSPDVMFFQDRDLRYVWIANPPSPLTVEGTLGKTDHDVFPRERAEFLTGIKKRVLETGCGVREEVHLVLNGVDAYYDAVFDPWRDGEGRMLGVSGYAHDVTERKRMEEELRVLYRRLIETQEEERRDVARELHEQVSQYLAYLKILMEGAARSPRQKNVAEMQETLDEVISGVRNLTLNLRPPMLDNLGLLPSLLWYFELYTGQTGVRVQFEHGHLKRQFPPEVSTAAYRIVQGALLNVARHSGVKDVSIRAEADKEGLSLTIEDQGVGFDLEALPIGASAGLRGMRERALALEGTLNIQALPGAGTRITAILPLSPRPSPTQRERTLSSRIDG